MTSPAVPSRRSFLKGGVLLAPLVAAPAAALAEDGSAQRLAALESEASIRALHVQWLRRINAGEFAAAAALFAEPGSATLDGSWTAIRMQADGAPDGAIALSDHGRRACGRYACTVDIETVMPLDNIFAQMAHAQGGGAVRHSEHRLMTVDYLRKDGGWTIGGIAFTPQTTSGRG